MKTEPLIALDERFRRRSHETAVAEEVIEHRGVEMHSDQEPRRRSGAALSISRVYQTAAKNCPRPDA